MEIKDKLEENIIYEPFTTLEEQEKAEEQIKKEIEDYIGNELNKQHELSEEDLEMFERNRDKLELHEIRI